MAQDEADEPASREALRAGAIFTAGGVAGGFLGAGSQGLYHTMFHQAAQAEMDRQYLSSCRVRRPASIRDPETSGRRPKAMSEYRLTSLIARPPCSTTSPGP
jgi:hypothetical protein